jgi:hypothetical protein
VPGLFEELLARVLPAQQEEPKNLSEAMRILKAEAPDFDPSIVGSKSRIPGIGAFQVPAGAEAAATPFGNIRYDANMLKDKPPQEIADTLLHELTHVRQAKPRGAMGQIYKMIKDGIVERLPYGQRPDEMEAFQAEADRRTRMGRAPLYGTPHFLDDSVETRGDIALHKKFIPPRR